MNERPTVLVVDDNESWRVLLSEALATQYAVKQADSYAGALEIMTNQPSPFYLLVADINLEGGRIDNQGMALVRRMREYNSLTSVIIVTGYPSIATAKEAFTDLNVFDYLQKSPAPGQEFSIDFFVERVRLAIADAAQRRARLVVRAMPKVAIFVDDSAVRDQVHDALKSMTNLSVEVSVPKSDWNEVKKQVQLLAADLVLVQVDPTRDPSQTYALLDLLRQNTPDSVIVGVGTYGPGHTLIASAITDYGVSKLVDTSNPFEICRVVQGVALTSQKRYLVAYLKQRPSEYRLERNVGQALVVTLMDRLPEGMKGVAIPLMLRDNGPIRFNVAVSVSPGSIDIGPSSIEDLIIHPTGDVRPAEFDITARDQGQHMLLVQFFSDGRWQRQIQLDLSVD